MRTLRRSVCQIRFSRADRISRPRPTLVRELGTSLPMVADASIDLVFSWDSLVHVEGDVMDAYIEECARVLSEGGFGWIHHSNLDDPAVSADRPGFQNPCLRGASMSADRFVAR